MGHGGANEANMATRLSHNPLRSTVGKATNIFPSLDGRSVLPAGLKPICPAQKVGLAVCYFNPLITFPNAVRFHPLRATECMIECRPNSNFSFGRIRNEFQLMARSSALRFPSNFR
jgi:hypothetical protein